MIGIAVWVETGYEMLALTGEQGLKVEALSRKVGVSKSSFYHHFADLEVFRAYLMEFHVHQCRVIAEKERAAHNIDPELIEVLMEHKTDLLFNRYLRVHQHIKLHEDTLKQSNQILGKEFIRLWAQELNVNLNPVQFENLYALALEHFFLQTSETNLTHQWLSAYFKSLSRMAQSFVS
jgi:AcrR family transcriptional regulator